MDGKKNSDSALLTALLILILTGILITGIGLSGMQGAIKGFLALQIHPARLINDFIAIAGIGPALVNASAVGFMGLIIIFISGIPFSGPTFAAIMTMTGFGLFGKTPFNILPIILGVAVSAKIVDKTIKDYLIIALFGTALGPLVTTLAWELGFSLVPSIFLGAAGGLATGLFLPAIAISMLHLHQGYNLYNMGLTCGFFGLFASALIKGFGHGYEQKMFWYTGFSPVLALLVPAISLILLLTGVFYERTGIWANFLEIQKMPGRLPSDFVDLGSLGSALVNSGLIGLSGSLYVYLSGSPFNGPVIGGLLTIMGFGAFGTHLRNSWPVVTGVIIATLVTGNRLNSPGPVLAAIFSTTLAPIAGEFGYITGIAAGFIHLLMVMQTGAWNGGMNLYNNGFAGGLTAAFIVSIIQWYRTNKEEF